MAANPQFLSVPVIAHNSVNTLTANTAKDGTGAVTFIQTNTGGVLADLVAPAAGLWVDTIVVVPNGTNVATVMRLFANNGSANTTAANNELIDNVTCPATTNSEVAALQPVTFVVKKLFPSGTKFFYTIGTTVAAGFSVTLFGGAL